VEALFPAVAVFRGGVLFFAVAPLSEALEGLLPNALEVFLREVLAVLPLDVLAPLFFGPVVLALDCARPVVPRRGLELVFLDDLAMKEPPKDRPAQGELRSLRMDIWEWPDTGESQVERTHGGLGKCCRSIGEERTKDQNKQQDSSERHSMSPLVFAKLGC
jgi:hypothetical protein